MILKRVKELTLTSQFQNGCDMYIDIGLESIHEYCNIVALGSSPGL